MDSCYAEDPVVNLENNSNEPTYTASAEIQIEPFHFYSMIFSVNLM